MAGHVRPLQDALSEARLRRNALAGAVRSSLLQLERTPAANSPTPQARHERDALADALAALLRPAPEPPSSGLDAEIATAMRQLDRLERRPLEQELEWVQ
jgi:hypothetical protein